MKLQTVIFIDQANLINQKAVSFDTPIWKIRLWLPNGYVKQKNSDSSFQLPFMADTDPNYPTTPNVVNDLSIDNINYVKYDVDFTLPIRQALLPIYQNVHSFAMDATNGIIYIHRDDHLPFFIIYSQLASKAIGFTDGPKLVDENVNDQSLIEFDNLEESVDWLSYGAMKFQNSTIQLDNTKGQVDDFINYFGFDISVLLGQQRSPFNTFKKLFSFYLGNIQTTLEKVTLSAKDKREQLSVKIPQELFTTDKFSSLGESVKGQPIPDAYGYCYGVKGYCLNENQALFDNWRHFKFAGIISTYLFINNSDDNAANTTLASLNPDFILEMKINDTWKPLPRNEAEFVSLGYGTSPSGYNAVTMKIYVNHSGEGYTDNSGKVITEPGVVGIPVIWAHQTGGPVAQQALNGLNEIRLTAMFRLETNPKDIIKHIGTNRLGLQSVDWDEAELEKELRPLNNIGLVLGEQKTFYEYIESIQNTSLLGFQFFNNYNLFSARLDNPNRTDMFEILPSDIININEVEIDANAENFATYVSIKYQKKWNDGSAMVWENRDYWESLMQVYNTDKVYEAESYMKTITEAQDKAKFIMQQYQQFPKAINNVKIWDSYLSGFDVRLYSIGYITVKLGDRTLLPRTRVKVVSRKLDFKTGEVVFNFIQCDSLKDLPSKFNFA